MQPNGRADIDLHAENAQLRKRVEELSKRIQKSQNLDTAALITILGALPDLIFVLNFEGRYLEVYTGEYNLLAAPTRELLGHTVHEALPAPVAEAIQVIIDRTLETQTTQSMDYELDVPDGTRWFNATIVPIVFATQPSVLWVARDVTERKLAEQESQRARDAAIESNRLKSQFLANVSHELRTPLNGVIGFAEILADTPLDNSQAEYLGHLTSCATTLLSIINEILDFSKLEANRVSLAAEPFDLVAMIHQVVEWFRLNNRDRPIEFTSNIAADLAPVLIGDEGRVRQILMNLLGNAAKFTTVGTVTVSVTLESDTDERCYVGIAVADTGVGISEKSLKTIFDPFVQADGSASRQFTGTGLGLSIVRTLVGLLDGALDVDSTVGVGTTFTVTLPFSKSTDQKPAAESSEPARTSTPEIVATPTLSILVAEDNPLGQKIIDRLLTSWGHRVAIAGDGAQALAMLAAGSFDLVLMDCHMPGLDG